MLYIVINCHLIIAFDNILTIYKGWDFRGCLGVFLF